MHCPPACEDDIGLLEEQKLTYGENFSLTVPLLVLGLLVAIPATLIYNGLIRRADVLIARWTSRQGCGT